jgi:hypothetical protein
MNSDDDNKLKALDLKVARALQIDVPPLVMPELPDVDENVATLPVRRRSKAPIWFAVAATVVLGLSIALRMSPMFEEYETLADEVLAHLDHEPGALRVTEVPVSDRRLKRAVPASLAVFDREATLITYANPCIINGKRVPHLVIQGQHGPVTILLMPEEKVDETTPLDGNAVHGVILPVRDGSIAIIGPREEFLEPIQENVRASLTWTT